MGFTRYELAGIIIGSTFALAIVVAAIIFGLMKLSDMYWRGQR
jgi:hypothetical protein